LWIPPGFAHGFLSLAEDTDVLYKTTDYYAPEHERCVLWNDPDIGIDWPFDGAPTVSPKDARGVALKDAEAYE
jgi:dTDP-4-dehydrorhamnose 3,5-epimerase